MSDRWTTPGRESPAEPVRDAEGGRAGVCLAGAADRRWRSRRVSADILRDIGEVPVEDLSRGAALRDLPDDSELRRQVLEYIVRVYDDADLDRLRTAKQDRLEALAGTTAETLIEQGEAKPLTRLLERRFGPLSRSTRNRIATAPVEQLDTWINCVLGEAEAS